MSYAPTACQIEALDRSHHKEGYIFGLDPGLGKTSLALYEYCSLRRENFVTRLLVICPNSVIGTWHDEIRKHDFNIGRNEIFVINYESIIYYGGKECLRFVKGHRTMLVLDESHRIKNFNSAVTKWITKNLEPRTTIKRLLTGTPLAESPMDLFPQLRMCGAVMGVNPFAWRAKWCNMGGFRGKQVKEGCKDPERLARFCAPYMFRATKVEWAKDLPEKTFNITKVDMTAVQRKLYKDVREEFCSEFEGKEITAPMAMAVMTKMMQISAGFVKTDDGVELSLGNPSPKIDAVSEWAAQFGGGNKFVVVAWNKWVVRNAADRLTKDGLNVVTLYGDSDLTVDQAKDQFNNDDSIDGIVMSIKKGGVGLTLLGSEKRPCADMALIQTTWSLIERLQVVDRIHRIGQQLPCTYTDICASSLDAEIVRRLNNKESAAEAVLSFLRGEI